ncbi:MAG: S41 family peptidase [Clostridiales bacterium]|nr:S41 family peptidase [Clostridiales bacterium]
MKYYYPNPHLDNFDWYKFLIYGLENLSSSESDIELIHKLKTLFSPICPDVVFFTDEEVRIELNEKTIKKDGKFYVQKHQGEDVLSRNIVCEQNQTELHPTPDLFYSFPIKENLYVSFPIAITNLPPANRELKALNKHLKKIHLALFDYNSLSVLMKLKPNNGINFIKDYNARIADIIEKRNIIQHFYPYFHEDNLQVIWDTKCEEAYGKVAKCQNQYEFYDIISQLMSNVHDTHLNHTLSANIGKLFGTYSPKYYLPFEYGIIQDTIYVTNPAEILELPVYGIITHINNIDSHVFLKEKLNRISSSSISSGYDKLISTGELFSSFKKDSIVNLTIKDERKGVVKSLTIPISSTQPLSSSDKIFIEEIGDNLIYLDLSKANYKEFALNIDRISDSRGVIMDLRKRPEKDVLSILSHFIEETVELGNLKIPCKFFPDNLKQEYYECDKWCIAPANSDKSIEYSKKYDYKKPYPVHMDIPIVFLINGNTLSFGETIAEMVKEYQIGTLIGESTAGCNGDAFYITNHFASFSMSVFKFEKRDGARFHGIGVDPDIYCRITYKDILKGEDKLLVNAKKYLLKNYGMDTNNN